MLPVLHDKLARFLHSIDNLNSLNGLYSDELPFLEDSFKAVRHDTSEGLRNIENMWEMEELPFDDGVSGSQDRADGGQERRSRAWKIPSGTLHPLDDVLIYRAVLITLLYCLSSDSSDLLDEDAYGIIVPIL
jgi:hypothetical protein